MTPITIGTKVQALDGAAGTLSGIVTDPSSHQPLYLIVKRGRLRPRAVVVPVSLVTRVTLAAIELDTTRQLLRDFPDYLVTVRTGTHQRPVPLGYPRPGGLYVPPVHSGYLVLRQRNVPDRAVAVERDMPVRDRDDREVGAIVGIIADPVHRRASHLIMRRDPPASGTRLVPADLVEHVHAGEVLLRVGSEHLDSLREYRPAQSLDAASGGSNRLHRGSGPFRKILVATDGAAGGLRATRTAADIAGASGAEVVLVFVLPPVPALAAVAGATGRPDWSPTAPAAQVFAQAGREALARVAGALEQARVPYTTRMEQGHPADAICALATAERCDLIVLGHHAPGAERPAPLDSIGEQVSRCAPCAVLIVGHDGRREWGGGHEPEVEP